MAKVEMKSPTDGSVLALQVTGQSGDGIDFDVSVRTPWFSGTAPASTYFNGSPGGMFREMSIEWRGWQGEKTWQDLEGRVSFAAQADSIGHVRLRVELAGSDCENRLVVVLEFEAGQLDEMADEVEAVLGKSVAL